MKLTTLINTCNRYFYIAKAKLVRRFSKARPQRSLPERKQEIVRTFGKQGNYRLFIETGTYQGDMVDAVKNNFNKIFSIELGETFAQNARKRFANFSHISILQGDSGEKLSQLLNTVYEPCLFWLDAHYSGDDARGSSITPIMSELKTVLTRPYRDTILIDDARLFNGVDYPTIPRIKRLVKKIRPEYQCTVQEDIIRIHQP